MIHLKSEAELAIMQQSAALVALTIAEVAKHIKEGVTTLTLDKIAEDFIAKNDATGSFKGYEDFPYTCCISVNDAVVHGFPDDKPLKDGDVISIDVGVFKNGYHGDSAYTFAIGNVAQDVLNLLKVTKQSLYAGIEKAVTGNRIGDIGYAIHHYTQIQHGYGVVKDLVGHGVGKELHEEPQVPNYGKRGNGKALQAGMVLAIEPMINLGTPEVITAEDGWTILTKDGKPSAHYEHNVAVQKGKAVILSTFTPIEEIEHTNPHLNHTYLLN